MFLIKKGLDTIPLRINNWLSVFTSFDGSFEIKTSNNDIYQYFFTTRTIVQNRTNKEYLKNYKLITQNIAEFF